MSRRMRFLLGGIVSAVLLLVMVVAIQDTKPWTEAQPEPDGVGDRSSVANDQARVVDTMFGPQVLALEVLGILLTAAMIGALVIARPLEAPDDDTHYSHPTAAQVAESDKASDPATHALTLAQAAGTKEVAK